MKTVRNIALFVLVVALGFCVASCGGYSNGKAKEMLRKAYDEKLKKDDYACMIEWYEDVQNEYLDGWEKLIKDNRKYEDYILEFIEFSARFNGKYPFFDEIESLLGCAGEDKMGASNYKKFDKLREKFRRRGDKLQDKEPESKAGRGSSDFDIDLDAASVELEDYDDYSF